MIKQGLVIKLIKQLSILLKGFFFRDIIIMNTDSKTWSTLLKIYILLIYLNTFKQSSVVILKNIITNN